MLLFFGKGSFMGTSIATTPSRIHQGNRLKIRRLIKNMGLSGTPFFVDVIPQMPAGMCHLNVRLRVLEQGGEQIFGWMIFESPFDLLAEFHSIWKHDGEYVDITTPECGEARILFLTDPQRKYEGLMVHRHQLLTTSDLQRRAYYRRWMEEEAAKIDRTNQIIGPATRALWQSVLAYPLTSQQVLERAINGPEPLISALRVMDSCGSLGHSPAQMAQSLGMSSAESTAVGI